MIKESEIISIIDKYKLWFFVFGMITGALVLWIGWYFWGRAAYFNITEEELNQARIEIQRLEEELRKKGAYNSSEEFSAYRESADKNIADLRETIRHFKAQAVISEDIAGKIMKELDETKSHLQKEKILTEQLRNEAENLKAENTVLSQKLAEAEAKCSEYQQRDEKRREWIKENIKKGSS